MRSIIYPRRRLERQEVQLLALDDQRSHPLEDDYFTSKLNRDRTSLMAEGKYKETYQSEILESQ